MSRRKQSNPKPSKRETADLDRITSELKLPLDRVYLRKFGEECLVLAKEHLKAGTVLGTYKCDIKESVQGDEDKGVLKVCRSENGTQSQVMIDNEGHWLKLMRTANLPTDANICLRISGRELVCTVTKDVNKEVELKVTCRIDDRTPEDTTPHFTKVIKTERTTPVEELDRSEEDPRDSEDERMSPKVSPTRADSENQRVVMNGELVMIKKSGSVDRETPDPKKRMLRREYSVEESDSDAVDDGRSSIGVTSGGERKNSVSFRGTSPDTDPRLTADNDKAYKCPLCPFGSNDKSAADKHLLTHRSPSMKKPSSILTNAKSFCEPCKIQFMSVDTYKVHKQFYCKSRHEKDDAYMSATVLDPDTNTIKPGTETVIIRGGVNGSVTSSMIQPQAIYAAISTNPLILLPCSLVNGQRLVPNGGVVPTGGPSIVLQSSIACPAIVERSKSKDEGPPSRKTSHPIMNFNSESAVDRSMSGSGSLRKRKMSEGDVLNLKKSCNNEVNHSVEVEVVEPEPVVANSDAPLDLTIKKRISQVSPSIPIPKRKNSIVPIGSPSYPNTSDSGSPPRTSILQSRMSVSPCSYSNESLPCYTGTVPVPVPRMSKGMAERLSPMSGEGEKVISRAGMMPPKLLKQGNNICEECQIVFYKYDNYLAHKKHYCAFRRKQLSAMAAAAAAAAQDHSSDDNNSNHSGHSKPYHSSDDSPPTVLRPEQFRSVITKSSQPTHTCESCGVSFSSPDNLNAHQTYYCIKRADSAMSKAAAMRAGDDSSPPGLESPFSGPEEWKCNYCDATCSSYDTIRRHLLTHAEVRGYLCKLCGYKGNTMRGMRSHAYEHIKEGSMAVEDFLQTQVTAEQDTILLPIDHTAEESDHSMDDIPRRERSSSESVTDRLKKESSIPRDPESPRGVDHPPPAPHSPSKSESGESGHQDNQQDVVNPMAFCDVVIKTENDHSSGEEEQQQRPPSEGRSTPVVKTEPEDKPSDLSKSSSPAHVTSVIRRACENSLPPKKKCKSRESNDTTEEQYCKSCDIVFAHRSNFLAHKQFYCDSRVIQNCHQETAAVQ